MTDSEQHYFANDGTDWRSQRSPVDSNEAREADAQVDQEAEQGDGPSATNEGKLSRTIVEESQSNNG